MTKSRGIGRGGRRPGAGRPRKKPTEIMQALEALATIRRMLEAQQTYLAHRRQQRRDAGEAVPALQRRVTALERHTGLVEDPRAPKPTRRYPLQA